MRAELLLAAILGLAAAPARAQIATLPRGVGAVQLGTRGYQPLDGRFDDTGARVSLAKPLDRDLAGKNLLEGAGGDQLKRLAIALADYDGGKAGLLDDLSLGALRGDVKADVKATYLGSAYGLTSHVSLFAAVPYIQAQTNTKMSFFGANNALTIKDRLGDLAFDELKSGLARAAAIGVQDIGKEIAAAGYDPIGHWEGRGFGDLLLGATAAWNHGVARHVRAGSAFTVGATVPTGRTDDPDALTDVPFGRGYFGVLLGTSQRVQLYRHLLVGGDASYTVNADARASRRLPVNGEALVTKDRERHVTLNPGDDEEGSALLGLTGDVPGGVGLAGFAKSGRKRHLGDRYHGTAAGDYATLARQSDTAETYAELSLAVDTLGAFRARRIPVPFVTAVTYHRTLAGQNANDTAYYEATLTSFFK